MPKRRCRICQKQAQSNSLFCAVHRGQAAFFAARFGESSATHQQPPAENREFNNNAQTQDDDAPADALRNQEPIEEALQRAFATIVARHSQSESYDINRWPQISLYYNENQLTVRPFYNVAPLTDFIDQSIIPLDVCAYHLSACLSTGGAINQTMRHHLQALDTPLRNREILTLDGHLLLYASLLLLSANHADGREECLAVFDLQGETVSPVALDDVRKRIGLERW
ncbi:MAG: hypothetical protein R3C68_00625 [Myxococcota bacterium]